MTTNTSFTQKRLRVTFVMSGANQVFPGTNNNTLKIEKLRVRARVQAVARLSTQAEITVFGMKPADMNALTIAWANPPVVLNNLITLEADSGNGFVQVFRGTMIEGQPNYSRAPDVGFTCLATTGYFQKITPAEPTSYPQATDINTVAKFLIEKMGFTFVPGGATGTFSEGAYFWGSLWDQLASACQAANADFYINGDKILVTNSAKPGDSRPTVVISPESGMIGYPCFERAGLRVSALFDPVFTCGLPLDVKTSVPNATGRWYPYSLMHDLEANTPNGQWMTQMQCLRVLA